MDTLWNASELGTESGRLRWALAILSTCERAMTYLKESERPTSTDWLNLVTARNLARLLLDEINAQDGDSGF